MYLGWWWWWHSPQELPKGRNFLKDFRGLWPAAVNRAFPECWGKKEVCYQETPEFTAVGEAQPGLKDPNK